MPPYGRYLETVVLKHKADLQEPISQLIQKDAAFVWEKPQQEAFENLKSIITSAPGQAYFVNNKETVLNVDASSTGLDAVINQEGKPVAFTLTNCERRYVNIERELLAIVCMGSTEISHICVRAQSNCGNRS